MSLRVAIDVAPGLHDGGGIARHVQRLVAELPALADPPELALFAARGAVRGDVDEPLRSAPRRELPFGGRAWRLACLASQRSGISFAGLLPKADVVHGTYGVLPRCGATPAVVTVHDLTFMNMPQFHVRSFAAYLRATVPRVARGARLVMADSHATARDLERLCGVDPARIRVVHLGYDAERYHRVPDEHAEAALARYGIERPYVLFVGTLEPRKNLVRLLDAFATLRAKGLPHRLVLAGEPGWGYEPILERLSRPDVANAVVRAGRVAEANLPALYRNAEAFAYPSFYEGFGLPPLEAMACGTPVVTSNASSLPEVVGDAGLTVPPDDVAALATALERALVDGDLRARLALAGPKRAAQFTWRETAKKTLAVYREAVGSAPV